MLNLQTNLQSPDSFPTPHPAHVDFVETLVSWIFLGEHDVFKVKKPVKLGFLDYGNIELRKRACEAEVVLNASLAPGIYLGVVPITRSREGTLSFDGSGEIVDWAVHMRRLAASRRTDTLLKEGRLGFPEVARLARRISNFHSQARCDSEINHFGDPEFIESNIRENFDQTRDFILEYLTPNEAKALEMWQLSFLHQHSDLFRTRIQDGRILDGHGDLRLQQIYLDSEGDPTILDRIEFNDRFRYGDAAADLAFLSMDLAYHGHVNLAEYLIAQYARETNDFDLFSVIDFYESYRAHVRAKVSGLLALDSGVSENLRLRAREEARKHFILALALSHPNLLAPSMIVVGGTLASGKSTIADWIGESLAAPVVDADRMRKHLLGVSPTQFVGGPEWSGAYSPAFTEQVYGELLRQAGKILDSGRPVVLDATFRSARFRKQARDLALSHKVPFYFVECKAPSLVCRERLLKRKGQASLSDARVELLDTFSNHFEPVRELSSLEHIVLDTSRSVDDAIRILEECIPHWPPRFIA